MVRETIRQILIDGSEYLPSIGSIWGLLLYAFITYFISLCCMRCLGAYTDENFNIEKAIKEQILFERKKREEREKLSEKVKS
jgi:uncharacterized BrkB/YihY/UPF0761 family membrane protein